MLFKYTRNSDYRNDEEDSTYNISDTQVNTPRDGLT